MTVARDWKSELPPLLERLIDGEFASEDWTRLNEYLSLGDQPRRYYHSYMKLHAGLEWRIGERATMAGVGQGVSTMVDQQPFPPFSPCLADSLQTSSPIPIVLSNTLHNTLGYFSEGMPLAYLLATVITGLGLLIGSLIHVSGPAQIVRSAVPSKVVSEPAFVGRITGMVDCKWEKEGARDEGRGTGNENHKSYIIHPKSLVALGDKLALASGLMEITYDTGAKVILQGPVTYEVETNGGYLAVGKLTGKLDKAVTSGQWLVTSKSEIRNQKSEISNPQSLIPNPFVVHTPTATVTDLGTEFGVEVRRDGVTETQVFVGSVRITRSGDEKSVAVEQTVCAGSAVRIDATGNKLAAIRPSGRQFVRALPPQTADPRADAYADLVLSMKPVVYYRMEKWPKDEKKGSYVLVDSAPGAHHGEVHADKAFPLWCRGKFGGALDLHGPGVGDYAIVPDYPKTDSDRLSVSAWVWASALSAASGIVQNWSVLPSQGAIIGQFGFGVQDRHLLAVVLQPDDKVILLSEGDKDFPRGQWQHVAFVADGAILRLYRNGLEVGATPYRGISRQGLFKNLTIACAMDASGARPRDPGTGFWDGRLDEMAVFNHALSAEQVRQLYTGPANTTKPLAGTSGSDENQFLGTDPTR